MAKFQATVLVAGGTTISMAVEAGDRAAAEAALRRRGKVLSLRQVRKLDLVPGMSPGERYTFLVRMSSMIGAKMGAGEALRLIVTTFGGPVRKAAAGLLDRVEGGMDLPTAMDADRKNFPIAMVALIKAGVHTGETWRALKDAAEFEYQMQSIRKGSGKELIQALVSFVLAGAITIASTEYFGPQVLGSDLFRGAKGINISWVVQAGNVVSVIMAVLLVLVGGLLGLATVGRRIVPVFSDRAILKVPFYKDLVLSRNNYATLYKLGLLIRSGVRVEEALALTQAGAPRGALQDDLKRAVVAVRTGKSWPVVMTQTLHPTDRAALSCATNREDIARTLDILASQYRDLYVQRMATFAPAMQMAAAVFMTISGGVLFGTTILPMLQLTQGLSQ
jgi:general secretion pathway protein F